MSLAVVSSSPFITPCQKTETAYCLYKGLSDVKALRSQVQSRLPSPWAAHYPAHLGPVRLCPGVACAGALGLLLFVKEDLVQRTQTLRVSANCSGQRDT